MAESIALVNRSFEIDQVCFSYPLTRDSTPERS